MTKRQATKPNAADPFGTAAPAPAPAPASAPKGQETPQEPASNAPTMLRKISVKSVYGKIDPKTLPVPPEKKAIIRITGIATAYESGEGNFGTWECLHGDFAALNHETGEVFTGNKAFLPGARGDGIIATVAHALRQDARAKIKFGVDVFAHQTGSGADIGHQYEIVPLIHVNVKNEAMDLLKSINAKGGE